MSINPFSYGKPIDDPERFIGHRREIEQVYSRLLSAFESSSIVGERRIGKTSLLKVLGHPDLQARYGLDPARYTFIYQDFQFLEAGTVPTRFWQRVLRSIRRAVKDHAGVIEEIELALKAETIDNYTLDDIFTLIDDEDLYIVLLLDEFENVTRNENFDNDFFAGLRALAIHHNLALVTSSRQELVELTHSQTVRSSPFFNIFASINLRPFSETDATELIDKYLAGSEVRFLLSELNLLFGLAGYHPYFLQMVSHHFFAAHQQGLDDAARRRYVLDKARGEADPIFHDYWHNSSPSQQILLTVLALRELERRVGQSTPGGAFDAAFLSASRGVTPQGGEDVIADLERYYVRAEQVMPDLERRGLVIKNPENSAYRLFSSELTGWIADEIIGEVDDLRGWRDWQKDESLAGVLPADVQALLGQVVYRLNPAYRDTLGKWVLEPATAGASLRLLETCLGVYEHHKEITRADEAPVTVTTVEEEKDEPAAQVPQGLFARVSQKLDRPDKDQAVELNLENAIESLDKQQREQLIYTLKRQILRYTGNLSKLQEDAAMYGSLSSAPLKLQNEIEEIENTIADLQEKLDTLEQEA
ncbi:MAG: AAA-like domain-containing protein [Chloroflexota bacterium]